jgi:hypothetical protein
MNGALDLSPVLAQRDTPEVREFLEEISRNFGEGGQASFEWLLIAVGLILFLIGSVSLRTWWRTRHLRPSPFWTFHHVAMRCGLTLGERVLLWRIARQQRLPSPLTLLLSPATMRHHARAYARVNAPAAGRAAFMHRVARLRRKVFA